MSIKNKKIHTSNAYRLKKIEDHLIAEGYVCISYIEGKKGIRRWVDCVMGGYDISYNPEEKKVPEYIGNTPPCYDPQWKSLGDQFFHIHVEHGASGSAESIETAIKKSRRDLQVAGDPRWIPMARESD